MNMGRDHRKKYIEFIEHILDRVGGGPFRVSNIGICKERKLPVIAGPIGYINKMESEGLIKRAYSSNSRTEYQFAHDPEKVRREISRVKIKARMRE